ncbi:hypothetical protein CLOP_g24551 [Closterium sp. NIES-67]|nr:hypothetical protein CLOP_g24551 [Closterium sp. NIES-67]
MIIDPASRTTRDGKRLWMGFKGKCYICVLLCYRDDTLIHRDPTAKAARHHAKHHCFGEQRTFAYRIKTGGRKYL